MHNAVKRGDIYYRRPQPRGRQRAGRDAPCADRPERHGNRHSPTVIAAAITSQTGKARLPTHIELSARNYGLSRDSVVLLEQIRTLDKSRLRERMGQLDGATMDKVNGAIAVSFGLTQ